MRNKESVKAERMSLRTAASELGTDTRFLSGYVRAMGIETLPIGNALTITRPDLDRIRRRMATGTRANAPCPTS